MKIVFITNHSFIDHSYTIIKELGKHIELTTFILGKNYSDEVRDFCNDFRTAFVKTGRYRNPLNYIRGLIFVYRIRSLKGSKYWFDAMPLHLSLWVKLLIKNPLIWVHDVVIHPNDRDPHYSLSRRLMFALFKKNICVASKKQSEAFRQYYPKLNPKVFQLPIIDYYENRSAQPPLAKNNNLLSLLFFGAIKPYKGIETLIEAAELLLSQNLDVQINICGKILYNHEYFRKSAVRLKDILKFRNQFLDYKLVNNLFLQNDIVVLPYKQVTQCGPLLIAYNLSIPVLCSDRPGFREYVDENMSGILFDNTPQSLAEKITFIYHNRIELERMRKYISVEMHRRFGIKSLIKEYLRNFEN